MPDVAARSLRWPLLGAFAAVAAVAVAVFAGLTLWSSRGDVQRLVDNQQRTAVHSVAGATADAYREAGGWNGADLRSARALAVTAGSLLDVRDRSGNAVTMRGHGMGPMGNPIGPATGPTRSAPVVVDGARVGTVTLRFANDALPPAERQLRDALSRTAFYGAGIAVLVALAVAYLVAAGIIRPLDRLTQAVQRLGGGDRSARANLTAPGELGVLAREVDTMAAKLEREDELRRMLTADVAHELRTPVSILRAHCEAIVDGVEETTPELMGSLHDEVLRLGNLIEDVETLSAAEAAGLRLRAVPVDLSEVVYSSVTLLAPQADAAAVTLRADEVAADAVVTGDPVRLAQILRNLVLNALKFTPPGGRVDVSLRRAGATVALRVTDTGAGISEADLPHVFERFWRGEAAAATRGSGIGLAVVEELVRVHGGTVDVSSRPGDGATFTVVLPCAEKPKGAAAGPGLRLRHG